jgi:hypothetical protein
MHYSFEISVTPLNTVANPVAQILHMSAGVLVSVDIEFPSGCAKGIRCALYDGSTQILPSNAEGFYALDSSTVHAQVWYDLNLKYNELIFVAWNIGIKYTHSITVMLEVQGPDEPNLGKMVQLIADVLNRLVDLLKGMF